MKTKYNDFWLTKNNKAANAYMDEVAKESKFTGHRKGYTILPHKIHRCYGLSRYEKLILVSQSKNNMYYLPNYLHVHPYLLVSE